MRIREDLEGVVIAYTEDGTVTLSAGDEIPDGVAVGDHLTEAAPEDGTVTAPKPRRRTTSK